VRAAGLTLPAVLAARAMVGLGEGVALPSMNNLVRSRQAIRFRPLLGCTFAFALNEQLGEHQHLHERRLFEPLHAAPRMVRCSMDNPMTSLVSSREAAVGSRRLGHRLLPHKGVGWPKPTGQENSG